MPESAGAVMLALAGVVSAAAAVSKMLAPGLVGILSACLLLASLDLSVQMLSTLPDTTQRATESDCSPPAFLRCALPISALSFLLTISRHEVALALSSSFICLIVLLSCIAFGLHIATATHAWRQAASDPRALLDPTTVMPATGALLAGLIAARHGYTDFGYSCLGIGVGLWVHALCSSGRWSAARRGLRVILVSPPSVAGSLMLELDGQAVWLSYTVYALALGLWIKSAIDIERLRLAALRTCPVWVLVFPTATLAVLGQALGEASGSVVLSSLAAFQLLIAAVLLMAGIGMAMRRLVRWRYAP